MAPLHNPYGDATDNTQSITYARNRIIELLRIGREDQLAELPENHINREYYLEQIREELGIPNAVDTQPSNIFAIEGSPQDRTGFTLRALQGPLRQETMASSSRDIPREDWEELWERGSDCPPLDTWVGELDRQDAFFIYTISRHADSNDEMWVAGRAFIEDIPDFCEAYRRLMEQQLLVHSSQSTSQGGNVRRVTNDGRQFNNASSALQTLVNHRNPITQEARIETRRSSSHSRRRYSEHPTAQPPESTQPAVAIRPYNTYDYYHPTLGLYTTYNDNNGHCIVTGGNPRVSVSFILMSEEPNWERNAPRLETWALRVNGYWPYIIYSTHRYNIAENIESFRRLPASLPCANAFRLLCEQMGLPQQSQPQQLVVLANHSLETPINPRMRQNSSGSAIDGTTASHTHTANNFQPFLQSPRSHLLSSHRQQLNPLQPNRLGVGPSHHFLHRGYDEELSPAPPNSSPGFVSHTNQEYAAQHMIQGQHIPPATFGMSQPCQNFSSLGSNNVDSAQNYSAPVNTVINGQVNNYYAPVNNYSAPVYKYYNYDDGKHDPETPNNHGDLNGGSEQTTRDIWQHESTQSPSNLGVATGPDPEGSPGSITRSQSTANNHPENRQTARTDLHTNPCRSLVMNPGNGFCGNGVLQLENPYKSWLSRLYGPTMNIRPLSLQVWAIKVSEGYSEKSRAPLSKKTQRSAESKKRKREGANDEDILISGLPEGLNQCSRTASSPVSQTSGSAKKFKREENDDIDLFVCENGSSVHGKLKAKLKLESLNDPYFQCGKCLMKFRKSDNKIGACPRHTGKFVNRVFDTDKLDCCWGLYKNQPCMMSKHVMIQYEH